MAVGCDYAGAIYYAAGVGAALSYKVLAVDPGGTTGYAIFYVNGDVIKMIDCGQIKGYSGLDRFVSIARPSVLVIEEFRVRINAAVIGATLETIEVVGVAKYLAGLYEAMVVLQQPSQKTFFNDERLKALGLYQVGQQHARDAIRHALYYLHFTKKLKILKP